MIFTRLYLDNIYCFKDFEVDLSFSRKVKNSTIPNEYLKDRKNFNYKRLIVLMGTNASGKTSLSRIMCALQNFIGHIETSQFPIKAIFDKSKPAKIIAEFVTTDEYIFNQLEIELSYEGVSHIKSLKLKSLEIGLNDSCNTMREKIKNNDSSVFKYYLDSKADPKALDNFYSIKFDNDVFNYVSSENTSSINKKVLNGNRNIDPNLLHKILSTFDPSIESVEGLKGTNSENYKGYNIQFSNGDEVLIGVDDVLTTNKYERFSLGTYDALNIAPFICSIIESTNNREKGLYFLDEKLASSHTELECVSLYMMLSKLTENSQLFYTTHNYEVIRLNLPTHSFVFLGKDYCYSTVNQPEKLGFTKNDRTLINYVKGNIFGTIPSTSNLDDIILE